nr:MAG TPA: hypothetical protein [Bacteriophage sp.]
MACIRYRQNFPPFPCPVECWILSISSTQAVGRTFHFLDVPGSRPSPQYIFLIHNHQLSILFSFIIYTFRTTISTKIPIHPILPNFLISPIYPAPALYHTLYHLLPSPGTFSLDKNTPKIYPYTISYIHPQITHFPSKIPKNGLKSLFFNR